MAGGAYVTLAGPGNSNLVVRRSRFLGYAAPIADGGELQAFLTAVRSRHPDARHIPYAWVGVGGATRLSDDGEPAGTGGRPCLGALARHELRGAAVAVARIFGGVLLGAANLGRAYGQAASAAVDAAGMLTRRPQQWFWITVPYADLDRAERALHRLGARIGERDFRDAPRLGAWVPLDAVAALREALPRARWEQ